MWNMKKIMCALLVLASLNINAQNLFLNDETTEVKFVTTHGVARLQGSFKGVQGSASFDPQQLQNAFIRLSFQTNTVTSTDNFLGPSLIKQDCFDVANHPTIELTSSAITARGKNQYHFRGTLKIKGISRQIVFPFTATANVGGYDFHFSFPVKRNHFNLNCNFMSKDMRFTVLAYAKKA
jgi:polyisoprenoid-binding protein YceI